jgi:hypothetical protein
MFVVFSFCDVRLKTLVCFVHTTLGSGEVNDYTGENVRMFSPVCSHHIPDRGINLCFELVSNLGVTMYYNRKSL